MGRPSTIQVGARLGKLQVLAVAPGAGAGHHAKAVCICDCGVTKKISSGNLHKMRSCGCSQISVQRNRPRESDKYHKLPTGVAQMNAYFGRYLKSAEKRNFQFNLSRDQFEKIVSAPCVYCGAEPKPLPLGKRRTGKSVYNGSAVANGIDRSDNAIGYTLSNSVSCCSECNHAKHTRSAEDFVDHAVRIALHNKRQIGALDRDTFGASS